MQLCGCAKCQREQGGCPRPALNSYKVCCLECYAGKHFKPKLKKTAEIIMGYVNSNRQKPTKEQAEAIRLADAAPDLLAACKNVLYHELTESVVRMLNDAVDKAEGV